MRKLWSVVMSLSFGVLLIHAADVKAPPPAEQKIPRPPKPGVKTPGVQVSITELKPEAVYLVPGTPDWQAIGDAAVYVSNKVKNSVSKLDPKTNKVLAVIAVGSQPCSGLTIGFGSLWVPNCGDNTVSRVDLNTDKVTATFPSGIADTEGGIASGAGSIWLLTDKNGTLARIDPADNKVVAEIVVPPGSFCVAFGEGAAWVTSTVGNSLTRVDPNTNLVGETIPVGKAPRFFDDRGRFHLDPESDRGQRVPHRS